MYNIARAKEAIKSGIKGYLLKDESGAYVMDEVNRLPFYLEGCPGIGKTQIVEQIANELDIGYVSFSLVHHTRNSLLGLPVITELENGDKYTRYTMSEVIARVLEQVEQGKKEGVLLLDEFPCMSETILPAMLAFLQTKNIGTHHLPEGWVVVLCGNPPEFNKSARTFDSAIMDRIRKMEIEFEGKAFLEYAESIGLHPAILDYLKVHPGDMYRFIQKNKEMELVTCRGWENLSHMLDAYEILNQRVEVDDIRQFLKSEEIAIEFAAFKHNYSNLNNSQCIQDILQGQKLEFYESEFAKLSHRNQLQTVEYYSKYAVSLCQEGGDSPKQLKMIAGQLKNLFVFVAHVDTGKVLEQMMYRHINGSEAALRILSRYPVEEYTQYCRERYQFFES